MPPQLVFQNLTLINLDMLVLEYANDIREEIKSIDVIQGPFRTFRFNLAFIPRHQYQDSYTLSMLHKVAKTVPWYVHAVVKVKVDPIKYISALPLFLTGDDHVKQYVKCIFCLAGP